MQLFYAISVFPYLDDWLIKNLIRNRLITQTSFCIQTIQSLGFLSNLKKSYLFPAQKFTFIGMEFLMQQNLVKVPTDRVQNLILTIKKIMSAKQVSARTFLSLLGKLSAAADLVLLGRLHLTSSSDVPAVRLETSYSSSRSPSLDKRYDSISLTMVDKPHSIRDRDFYPSSRSQILPLYGCQSLRMGSSFRADNTILSWSLDRKPIPAPYQYVRNDGHTISTETSQNIYSPFLHYDIHRQHNGGLIYINKQGGTHSPNLCVEVWKILNWCLEQDIVIRVRHIPGKFNILADRLSRLDKPIKTEWALDQTVANSVFQMLNFPNVDLFATRFNHRLPLYVSPVQDYKALAIDALSMDWNHLHAYAFPPFILIPAVLEKIRQHQCRIVLIAPFWPQQQWFSELLLLLVSAPIHPPLISKTTDSIQRKICPSKPPNSRPSRLGVIKQSIRDKKFSRNVADFVSRSRRASTQKVYNAKWTIYSNWCHTKKVNPISAPITVIADFLIFLFSEKKCQISTIKGYRSMISNTLKFKTGNRIGSNPVLSELIRSFELQQPVQRSLTPKWDLSWVLVCLQKPPFEPLDKASKFHVTIKTAFLLALATAKRCSEIHALDMDSQHLRFNQSDGSVSLILKSGFLAKNQLPSLKPDPIVVP